MFGRNDDKKELRENMEQIKEIVEGSEENDREDQDGGTELEGTEVQETQESDSQEVRQPEREIDQTKPELSQESGKNVESQEIPEPPESRDPDVPSYDRGPLFIRQEKFRRAANLIKDMRYLVNELENSAQSLEKTIDDEEKIQHDMAALLSELDQERSEVRDFVSPGE